MQQHHAVLQAIEDQRRARHEQLSNLGYPQLVEGFTNVTVSPRKWNGQSNGSLLDTTLAGTTNGGGGSSSSSSKTVNTDVNGRNRPPPRYPKAFRHANHTNDNNTNSFAHPRGKGKGKDHNNHKPNITSIGNFIASNEDPIEEERKKELRLKAFGDIVYDANEETLRNDLSMNYLNTGRRPQSMLQGCELEHRFEECVDTGYRTLRFT